MALSNARRIEVTTALTADLVPWNPDLSGVCEVVEGPLEMELCVLWTAEDGKTATGVWRCKPSTIRLTHPYDETFTVVEGKMSFTPEGGEPEPLGPGDVITIPEGSTNVITVEETVTKVWSLHSSDALEF
jgi:uncharacterized cupin superfamily protein